jgi:hypothetical protein
MANLFDVIGKKPKEFLKFDLEPEIGDTRATNGAMISHDVTVQTVWEL